MGCYYKVDGKFSKPLNAEQLTALRDTFIDYGEDPAIEADCFHLAGSMSYSSACGIDELLKEFATEHGIGGTFVTDCDGEQNDLFVGPAQLALAAEEQRLIEQIDASHARLDEVQKLLSAYYAT
jgi:hypothetical protein